MSMKVKYKILYKSGAEDEIIQEASENVLQEVNDLIIECFKNGADGYLALSNGEEEGFMICLSDVSRVSVKPITD